MNAQIIEVLDTVNFETLDGMDVLENAVVWAIEPFVITFRWQGRNYQLPRAIAEQESQVQLVAKYDRASIIAELIEAIA